MTAQTSTRAGGNATVQNFTAALRAAGRRWQFWLLLAVLGVLFAVVVQLVTVEDQERYGLNNTDLDGYAAVAAVLQDHGVSIHQAPSAEIAREQLEQRPEAAVVVLEQSHEAGPRLVEELAASTRDVVWISPTSSTRLSAFEELNPAGAVPASPTTDRPDILEAGAACPVPAAERAESLRAPGQLFTGGAGCFVHDPAQGDPAHALAETDAGLVFGAPDAFTNRHITAEGNASLALSLFGQEQDLIWYTPSGMDTVSSEEWASPWDFMPDWVDLLAWWLLLCAALLLVVAGRRHGPVVVEPLPVEVPASESAEGRGRLYQQADAAQEAARTLRSAHLLRLTRLLRLGPGTPEQTVIGAVAGQTGGSPVEIARTLDAGPISGNSEMVGYAQRLAALEDEIRIRLGHGPRRLPDTPADSRPPDRTTPHETPREETL